MDVVEAYETVVPELRAGGCGRRWRIHGAAACGDVYQFFDGAEFCGIAWLRGRPRRRCRAVRGRPRHIGLDGILMASIGPVTSATLREFGLQWTSRPGSSRFRGWCRRSARPQCKTFHHRVHRGLTEVSDQTSDSQIDSLLCQRATAIRRGDVGQQKICHALVGVDLVFDAGEAVAFVFVNLVFDRAAAFLDCVDHLLRF